MIKITWNLDEEEPIDKEDLLGAVKISSTENNKTISDDSLYLDDFFLKLCEGLRKIKETKEVAIDLLCEPDPLIFERVVNREIKLSYGKSEMFIENRAFLETELKKVFIDFYDYVLDKDPSMASSEYHLEMKKKIEGL